MDVDVVLCEIGFACLIYGGAECVLLEKKVALSNEKVR